MALKAAHPNHDKEHGKCIQAYVGMKQFMEISFMGALCMQGQRYCWVVESRVAIH